MKPVKRIFTIIACAAIAVSPLSGCSIFGGNNGCKHNTYHITTDDENHYKVCEDCDKTFFTEAHTMNFSSSQNDKVNHFDECVICGYRNNFQPHELSEWSVSGNDSVRKCTVKGCKFEEKCTHPDMVYVQNGNYHHTYCEHCNKTTADETHVYDYSEITETTHSRVCKCGKKSEENVPHTLELKKSGEGFHAEMCVCGYKINEQACDFGDYKTAGDIHYKRCSVCLTVAYEGKHRFELTPERKRVCTVCGYVDGVSSLLLGTWKYGVGTYTYRLTLNKDWSYSITRISNGATEAEGDYFVSAFNEDADGNYNGEITFVDSGEKLKFKILKNFPSTMYVGALIYSKE